MTTAIVSGGFDNLGSRHVRFLQESSRAGSLHVLLLSDDRIRAGTGQAPKFPQEERRYLLQSIRYVDRVTLLKESPQNYLLSAAGGARSSVWVAGEDEEGVGTRRFCETHGIRYAIIRAGDLAGFPDDLTQINSPSHAGRKVVVTGCYDWFHSGHVRFFEEVSELGDLFVIVGHDANLRLLKGKGHPLFPQDERRYLVQSVRYVRQALISSGAGWLDAEPEILRIRPDIYAVNEDGDKPEKREFCRSIGIEYVVLKRQPKEGLPRRQSTNLRGF